MENPCRFCERRDKNKDNEICYECEKRIAYANYVARASHFMKVIKITDSGEKVDLRNTERPGDDRGKAEAADSHIEKSLCEKCGEKPTIHPNSKLCASCLAKKKYENGGPGSRPGKESRTAKGAASQGGQKAAEAPLRRISIDFGKYAPIIDDLKALAEKETRTLELQIIHILKTYLAGGHENERPL